MPQLQNKRVALRLVKAEALSTIRFWRCLGLIHGHQSSAHERRHRCYAVSEFNYGRDTPVHFLQV